MGIDIIREARGHTTAAAGVLGIERGAAGRLMGAEGKGSAPGRVKEKVKGPPGRAASDFAHRSGTATRSASSEGAPMTASHTASTGLVLVSLFLGGCSSMKVGSQRVEEAALAKVKTFAVVVAPQDKVPMDPALRDFLGSKIGPAIVAEMTAKGYAQAPEESADVTVATQAFIGVADVGAIRWNPTVVGWYPWGPVSTGFYASSSVGKEISFVIDVGDVRVKELFWRGWAAGGAELGAQHDPTKVRRLVAAVLSDLPKAKS